MLSLLSLTIGILLLTICKNTANFDVMVCVVIVLFSAAYVFDLIANKSKTIYAIPLVLAYFVRIVCLFYDVYSNDPFNLPLIGGELASDPLGFYNSAILFSQGFTSSYGGAFSKMFGAIFYLTGASRLWAEFIVILFSVVTLHVTAKTLDLLDVTQNTRKNSMYLICLMPNYVFLSVVFRRESIITMFFALSIYCFLKWVRDKGKTMFFALAACFALMSSLFHGAMALIIVAYVFAYMIYDPVSNKFVMKGSQFIGTLFFAGLFIIVFLEYGSVFFGKLEKLSSSSEFGVSRGAGGSSYARYVGDGTTPLRMLIYTVPRFLYYMFSPFPWQWRGVSDVITFLMSSFFYMYIIISAVSFILKSEKGNVKRNIVIILLFAALMMALVFAWGVTNTGTATRHRDKFIVLFTVIYALSRKNYGVESVKEKKNKPKTVRVKKISKLTSGYKREIDGE